MAVIATPLETILVARYQTGVSSSGAPIINQKSLTGIKASATDQEIYDVAVALYSLLEYPLIDVRRDNRIALNNE